MAQTKQKNLRMDEDESFETGEAITIPDGTHKGVIVEAYGEVTPQGYRYFQLVLTLDNFPDAKLRYGCPIPIDESTGNIKAITPNSKLGKLMEAFGLNIDAGSKYSLKDIKQAVLNKNVKLMTQNEPSRKNENVSFASIVENSIKPL